MKPAKGVSLYSRFVNRPVGRVLARMALRLGVSANAVTGLSALAAILALALLCLARPSIGLGIAVALLLVASFALDSADGQVARMTATSSSAGEWLDHAVDAGKHVALHSSVLVGWFRFVDQPDGWLVLPLLFQVVTVVMFSAMLTAILLKRQQPARPDAGGAGSGGRGSTWRAVALLPADHGVLCWSFVLWGVPDAFRLVYLMLGVLSTAIVAALLLKWYRELVVGDQVVR